MITYQNNDLIMRLYVQPKASRDHFVGQHNDELKLTITAPPVEGQANHHLIQFLAKQFHVAKRYIIIEKGETGRHKQVRIIEPKVIPAIIQHYLTEIS